jgi:hypothetical protein
MEGPSLDRSHWWLESTQADLHMADNSPQVPLFQRVIVGIPCRKGCGF